MACGITDAPEDLEGMIIYEIATKNYTSPDGPESGTFASLEERLPYLEELGIHAIWLSGHQLCDANHFYNIWTEYACIRPDQLDLSLGTEMEFKHLINSIHSHGMKIFLDVITHGVMENSSLVKEHPDWFAGSSWGMRDFDWYGGHNDLDEWWVNTWVKYVREFGVDGFRLDVAHYRNDLWALIRKKSLESGKRIVIIAENGPAIRGVTDILQHGEEIAHNYGVNRSSRLLYDAAGHCRDTQTRVNERYEIKITYEDGTIQDSAMKTWYQDFKVCEAIREESVKRLAECAETGAIYQEHAARLRVENIYGEKAIHNIEVRDKQGHIWNSNTDGVLEVDYKVTYTRKRNGLLLEFPLRIQDGQYLSIQLSCHDGGWVGYQLDENPYTAKGSRYLAGYAALLAPGIPVFMAGEEFNADYRPLPGLSPDLFGGELKEKGHWLYGSWIDWDQLKIPEKAEMLLDMKTIIGIRRSECDLIKPCKMGEQECNFEGVEYDAGEELPVPYCYHGNGKTVLIAANPYDDRDVPMRLKLEPVLKMDGLWRVTPLYGRLPGEKEEIIGTKEALSEMNWMVRRDKIRQGGLLVLKFEQI